MAIVMISSISKVGRTALAMQLAQKTGWPYYCREDLLNEATAQGIKVGRLEVAMIKTPGNQERLAQEKQIYLAFATERLCSKAEGGNLIYHGRSGHLLLPGVSHCFRVELIVPREVMAEEMRLALKVTSDRASSYLDSVTEDIEKWFHFMHGVDPKERGQYDLILNMETMSRRNAASLLCSACELPDFMPTPASRALQNDLSLSARARLRLALDPKTAGADLEIRADNGALTVKYMPRQGAVAKDIPQVLMGLEGCREITCTMAETNILWIQEAFSPDSATFNQINHVAQRWGAAVELLRTVPLGTMGSEKAASLSVPSSQRYSRSMNEHGGVEDDDVPGDLQEDGGLSATLEKLVSLGRSGGGHTVIGSQERIIEALRSRGKQALVVIGDMFMDKDHLVRTRQTRELALAIQEKARAPVITSGELKSRYLFEKKHAVKLIAFALLSIAIYWLIFSNQRLLLEFLAGDIHRQIKWLSPVALALFVPALAYVYGTFAALVLKLIDID